MEKTQKRPLAVVMACMLTLSALLPVLGGCLADPVEVKVVLKNSTDYELSAVAFNITPSRGSPMFELITSEDAPLSPGEEREVTFAIIERDIENEAGPHIRVLGDDEQYTGGTVYLNPDKNETTRFEITCSDDMRFTFTKTDG